MADVLTFPDMLRGAVLAEGLGFYDGYVPERLPETNGYIDPYAVLWSGLGEAPPELPACGTYSEDTLIWDFQITVVGASAEVCRQAAKAVKTRLLNMTIGTGRVRPNPDGFNQQSPVLDTQTTPARFMLPLQMRLITN